MDEIVKGIVLKSIDYMESDKILTILSVEKGKISVRARGAKKQTSKLKAFCQPFCFADFELTKGKKYMILSGAKGIDNFFDLIVDIEKYSFAFSVLEILDKICVENQDYAELTLQAIKCLNAMNYSQISPKLLLSKFMMSALICEGFSLNLHNCARCDAELKGEVFLDFVSGEIFCGNCKSEDSLLLDRAVFSVFKILEENDYNNLNTIKFSEKILDKTLFVLIKNFSFRYEIRLNSLKL